MRRHISCLRQHLVFYTFSEKPDHRGPTQCVCVASLRKHPFLLALRRWGRFAQRNVTYRSVTQRQKFHTDDVKSVQNQVQYHFSQWYFPSSGRSRNENLKEMVASSPFAARSRVLARLVSLAQIGELARRLKQTVNPVHLLYDNNRLHKHIVWALCGLTFGPAKFGLMTDDASP